MGCRAPWFTTTPSSRPKARVASAATSPAVLSISFHPINAVENLSYLGVCDVARHVLNLIPVRGLELRQRALGARRQHDAVGGGEEGCCYGEADATACAGDDDDF